MTYTTRQDAINAEIIAPITNSGENPDDYDIEAIADKAIGGHETGYTPLLDHDDFWNTVIDNQK